MKNTFMEYLLGTRLHFKNELLYSEKKEGLVRIESNR